MATVTLHVRFAWWANHYLAAVVLLCRATGLPPNMDKVEYWVRKGIRIETRNDTNQKTA